MKTSKIALFSALLTSAVLASIAVAQPKMSMTKQGMAKPSMAKPSMAKPIGLVGTVAGSFTGNEFILRANGETYRVRPLAKVNLKSIRGGDRVRVWGRPTGLRINFANVRVLQVGASGNPTDYNPAPNETVEKQPAN